MYTAQSSRLTAVDFRGTLFIKVIGALYYAQHETADGWRYGLDQDAFLTSQAPYSLADFGTTTFGASVTGDDVFVAARVYHRVLARMDTVESVGGGLLMRTDRDHVPSDGYQYYAQKAILWEPSGIAVPTLEVDYHSVLANSVKSPDGAGPEGEVFTSTQNFQDGCNVHSISNRVLFPGKREGVEIDNFLSPGAPASTFMLQAALRAGSSENQLGIAATATVAAAMRRNVGIRAVQVIEVQWTMVHPPLSTAIVYLENSMASLPSFATEQLLGVLGVPPYQLNDEWVSAKTNHSDATKFLRLVAAQRPGSRKNATLPFPSNGAAVTVSEIRAAIDALGPARGDMIVAKPSTAEESAEVLFRDLREILLRYLMWERQPLLFEPTPATSPYNVPVYLVADSFNRPGLRAPYRCNMSLGVPEAGRASAWRSTNLVVTSGHLTAAANATASWGTTLGADCFTDVGAALVDLALCQPDNWTHALPYTTATLSVEVALQQVPADWPLWDGTTENDFSLRWSGLVWRSPLGKNVSLGKFGFFGILSDRHSETDGVTIGWRPTSSSPISIAHLKNPSMTALTFSAEVLCSDQASAQHWTMSNPRINDVPVAVHEASPSELNRALNGTSHTLLPSELEPQGVYDQVGLLHGMGFGRTQFQNFGLFYRSTNLKGPSP